MKLTEAQILLKKHLLELRFCRADEIKFEFKFCAERKWLADLAIPTYGMLFECDGGMFSGGHRRGKRLEDEYEKQNWAQAWQWHLYRFTNRQILNGDAKQWIQKNLIA